MQAVFWHFVLSYLACKFDMLLVQCVMYFWILYLWTSKIQHILCTSPKWQKESVSNVFLSKQNDLKYILITALSCKYFAYVGQLMTTTLCFLNHIDASQFESISEKWTSLHVDTIIVVFYFVGFHKLIRPYHCHV